MKVRTLSLLGVAALALALGAVTSACDGGDDEMTLEEYFAQAADLGQAYNERTDELESEYDPSAAETDQEALEVATDLFREGMSAVETLVTGLEGLEPPSKVADTHQAAVDAGREAVTALEQLVDDLESADSPEDALAVLEGLTEDSGLEAFSNVCEDLQKAADDNDVDVDLQCSDGEEE